MQVELKECEEEEVAEEMDDNLPYRSEEDSGSEKNVDETLLMEEVPEIEEEGELKKK